MERYKFNIIKDEIQFEIFSRDLMKLLYPTFGFQLYGRKGQAQYGIDGYSTKADIYFQSKHKSKDTIKDQVIIGELINEFNKAKPKIEELSLNKESKYLFFTTHTQSTIIQDEAKKLSSKEITVEYWGWETIESSLNNLYKKENVDFFSKYYPDFVKNLDNNVIPKQLSIKSVIDLKEFVGRQKELESINEKLKEKKVLLMSGIGGIGKSSIVNQYLFKSEAQYNYYGFFEGISSLISDLKYTLNLKSENEDDLLKEATIKLRTLKGNKLFIIDNISNIDEQFNTINILLSLKDYGFNILFTSRETTDKIACLKLDIMNTHDAKELFNSIYKVEDTLLEELLGYLDNHTFFIEKTAKTLKSKDSLTPKNIKDFFDNGEFSKIKMNRKESFEKFLDELFNLDNLDDEEILALKQISIFPATFISFEDLTVVLRKKDKSDFEDILNYLSEKGWLIKYNDEYHNGYKLHQINKEYLFSSHKPNFDDLKNIINFYNTILHRSAEVEVGLYHKNRLIYFESLYKSLKILNIQTGEIFILFKNIGNIYFHLGKIKPSLEVLQTALEISNNIKNLHKIYLAEVYTTLGEIYRRIGDSENALNYIKESILIFEDYFDENSLKLAGQYSNLGHIYKTFGQTNKSLDFFLKALKIIESSESDYKADYVYKGLAEIHQIKGNYKKSLEFFKKTLYLRKKFFEDNNPLIAQSYNDLGFIYAVIDMREKAVPLYIEAIKRYEYTLGENHIDTASVYNNLGETYRCLKQYVKAYPLIEKAMTIRESEQGIYAIETAMSYNTMGVYNTDIAKYDESIKYLNKSLVILNSTLGVNHEYSIQTQKNIEHAYSLMKKESISKVNTTRNSPCSCGSGKKYKRCCG